eukprot:Cvel_28077.t1-p1 / transcript=Cvel_28077.t1 / gene=Cvel_28077 / organism=Chromera_velia_CCMP2878 / gene_product=5'-3' exoribonuclease 1, putative / transcript_product=5'-3' exoribonuclease 1, putative / location=Cvel_scaffold3609:10735-15533(+) / protein_length=382 / sequence_SO=supercontig / SO=protein_coding / is_pseudo=false
MFRWLVSLYPAVRQRVGTSLGERPIDNFYIDMNGIIHMCTHANAEMGTVKQDEEAMFGRVFEYLDRLFKIINPAKNFVIAVDGVAPRAKMNQQRSRRFRSAKEAELMRTANSLSGLDKEEGVRFDSSVITPGTEFMQRLHLAFQKWLAWKVKSDKKWQTGVTVVYSGCDVPGEGEHKIMDFIREEKRTNPDIEKQSHCMYGLDADLIMLSLISHLPKFVLLREKTTLINPPKKVVEKHGKRDPMTFKRDDFEVFDVSLLREIFRLQMSASFEAAKAAAEKEKAKEKARKPGESGSGGGGGGSASGGDSSQEFEFDLNRLIDDIVCLCILVGNDFVPTIPHLDIMEGSLNDILGIYGRLLPKFGGYLTDKAAVHPGRLEVFLK